MTTKNTKATVATVTNKSNTIRSKQRAEAKAASVAPKAKAAPEPTNFKRGDEVVTKAGVAGKVGRVKGDSLTLNPNDKRRRPFTVSALEVKPAKPTENIEKVSKPSPRRGKPEAKNEAAVQTKGELAATKARRVAVGRKAAENALAGVAVKMTGQVNPSLVEELVRLRKLAEGAEYALVDMSSIITKLEARFGITPKKGKK